MKAVRHSDGRVELDGTPEELAKVLGLPGYAPVQANGVSSVPVKRKPGPSGPRSASVPSRIKALLQTRPDHPFSIKEIAAALGLSYRTASNAALKAASHGRGIQNAGRGLYRALVKEKTA